MADFFPSSEGSEISISVGQSMTKKSALMLKSLGAEHNPNGRQPPHYMAKRLLSTG